MSWFNIVRHMNSTPYLSILLPVRNEGLNLRIMIKILGAVLEIPYEIVVVCDSPEDESIPVVKSMQAQYPQVRLVINTLGRGVINAVKAGVNAAEGKYVLIFAADEVGPVLAIRNMLDLAEAGCDFVSCTRYAYGGRRLGGSWVGGVLSRAANWLFYHISGCAFTDATTGIKLFTKPAFEKLNLRANPVGWAVAFEMAIKAQLAGLKLGEVPITSIDRLYGGESTFRLGSWLREYLHWFWWGTRELRRAPARKPSVMRKTNVSAEGMGFIAKLSR